MSICKRTGIITAVTDLTKTAREVEITMNEALECPAGSFINLFMDIGDTIVRRAFSVVSTNTGSHTLTLAIRHSLNGTMTPEFWKPDIIGRSVELMGPLGMNTSDKLSRPTLYLFAYGIGASVIKAIAEYGVHNQHINQLTIMTGSRTEDEIIYRDYFNTLALTYPKVTVRHVVSSPIATDYPLRGYIQEHLDGLDFNNADLYLCGQKVACDSLLTAIDAQHPENSARFIESFH